MTPVATLGLATLYRKESYNGRTTPIVEWVVRVGDKTMRTCYTKRDALAWLDIYKD